MKKIITSVAAAAVLTTGAFAAGMNADNRGNYLVSPAYFALGGYETTFEVFNTKNDVAVVAKVVIREGDCSQELRDFLIFLSPGDAFRGTIKKDTDGKVKVYSEDDSGDPLAKARLKAGEPLIASNSLLRDTKVGINSSNMIPVTGDNGYIEVFSLLELNATALGKDMSPNWEIGKALDKKLISDFYDNLTKQVETNTSSTYGTASQYFLDANITDAIYNGAFGSISTGKLGSNKETVGDILTITAAATNADTIREGLLTGTVNLVNNNSKQAMSVAMYGYNFDNIQNSILGERGAETNYLRVFGHDLTAANAALRTFTSAGGAAEHMMKRSVYIPYYPDKDSKLNMLFLAKNLSNYKCDYKNEPPRKLSDVASAQKIEEMKMRPIQYEVVVRDLSEEVAHTVSSIDPFSGGLDVSTKDRMASELSQLSVNDIVKKAKAETTNTKYDGSKGGWISVNIISPSSKFIYDVNESLEGNTSAGAPAGSAYAVDNTNNGFDYPILLPSYMQIIPVGDNGEFTNMYIPASSKN